MNLRKFARIPVGSAVSYSSCSLLDGEVEQRAIARDLSAGGMYVFALNPPPVGSLIRLEIPLPGFRSSSGAVWLEARGRVVRVEPEAESADRPGGFAIVTERFALMDHCETAVKLASATVH